MKKKLLLLALALCLVLTLAACGCKHEIWNEADCLNPKTCAECGETEGEALGHNWTDATCDAPKTCSVCGETEGEALGHNWTDATCDAPKTCSVCGETEGEALGHTWVDATTEAPKTCTVCAATEGERIITDARFTTAEAQHLFGTWEGTFVVSNEELEAAGLTVDLVMKLTITFGNDGSCMGKTACANWDEFMGGLRDAAKDMMYAEFASMGYDETATDALIEQYYGMTLDEMIESMMAQYSEDALRKETPGVYFVKDGMLYLANDWNADMNNPLTFEMKDGKLFVTFNEYGLVEMSPVAQ